jgi:hypothetical protein
LQHFEVDINGVFLNFLLGGFCPCPFAALFDGGDGVFIAVDGVIPVLEVKSKVAEVASCLETAKGKGRRSPNF